MPAIACQRVSRDLSKRAGEIFQIALDVVAVVAVVAFVVAVVVVAVVKVISVVAFGWLQNVLQVQSKQFSASMGANENNRNSLTKVNGEFQQQQQQQIMSTRTGMTGMHINRKLNTLLALYIHTYICFAMLT